MTKWGMYFWRTALSASRPFLNQLSRLFRRMYNARTPAKLAEAKTVIIKRIGVSIVYPKFNFLPGQFELALFAPGQPC